MELLHDTLLQTFRNLKYTQISYFTASEHQQLRTSLSGCSGSESFMKLQSRCQLGLWSSSTVLTSLLARSLNFSSHGPILACPHDVASGFPQSDPREHNRSHKPSNDLLDITHRHFYHILGARSKPLKSRPHLRAKTLSKEVCQRICRPILLASYFIFLSFGCLIMLY